MANKLTKLVIFAAAAGAAAGGIYYYMQKKEAEKDKAFVDGGDVYDDDDSDSKKRFYVNLNLDNVESALSKAKEKIADSYHYVKDSVKSGFEGSSREFVDLTEVDEDGETIKNAEEKLSDAASEGVTKVENFFDEEE
jgi:hypothetical protein